MNISQRIKARLHKVYSGKDEEFLEIARFLFYLLAVLAVLALVVSVFIKSRGIEKYVIAGLFLFLSTLAALVLFGRAKFSSLCLSYVLSLVLSAIIFVNPIHFGYIEFYMIGFMNLFIMGLTALVGFYSWQNFPIAIISSIAVILNFFLRSAPIDLARGLGYQFDDVLIVSLLSFFTAGSLYLVQKRSKGLLLRTSELNQKADRQLDVLHSALSASSDVLFMGDELIHSASKSSELSEKASQLAVAVAFSMQKVLSDSEKLLEELDGIAQNSGTVKASTESQSSVVNQTSSAIEEMTASIHNIANITRDRRQSVLALAQSTEDGQEIVNNSSRAMQKVEESTGSILEVIKVISAVAAQTNLLAMNAAIEAAHAGDYGRGFAVVADEIRKLSEQTNKNVKAVTETVKSTISDIQFAGEGNSQAVTSFAGIAREANLVALAIEEIISGLDELSKGTDEITRGVTDSVTSTNTLRTAVSSLDIQILGAKTKLDSLKIATTNANHELEQVRLHLEEIHQESQKVENIGLLNSNGISTLKQVLENTETPAGIIR